MLEEASPIFLFYFERFYTRFNGGGGGGYMRFGQDFSRFGHDLLLEKIFLAA